MEEGEEAEFAVLRANMVAEQIEGRGIRDTAVLQAMRLVPRHEFISPPYQTYAYDDTPLPIPAQQTISQPYIVAYMLSLLELQPTHRVLEIGTGSGYVAAVLSRMVAQVYTVERHEVLVQYARRRLTDLGYTNVQVRCGDGTEGWSDDAPYDAILVSAGGPSVPLALKKQLAINGRLIIPVGRHKHKQRLVLVNRQSEDSFVSKTLGAVAFVPLVGAAGW